METVPARCAVALPRPTGRGSRECRLHLRGIQPPFFHPSRRIGLWARVLRDPPFPPFLCVRSRFPPYLLRSSSVTSVSSVVKSPIARRGNCESEVSDAQVLHQVRLSAVRLRERQVPRPLPRLRRMEHAR